MTLGDIINEYRKNQHLSMDSFADKSGLSKAYISLLEKNKHPKTGKAISPSIQVIKQAANGMNIEFNELFKMLNSDVDIPRSEKNAFSDYLQSLGYNIYTDDPEHRPYIIYKGKYIFLEFNTLDELKEKIDNYANLEVQTELMRLQQIQIKKDQIIKESLIKMQKEKLKHRQEELKAAHERTDIEITQEMINHDNDIMDDENF